MSSVPTSWVRGFVGVAVLFVILEAITRAELVTPQYLPPASSILAETGALVLRGSFWSSLAVTMQACLLGLAVAAIVAVPVGVALGLSSKAYTAAMTVIELLRPIPSVALIPLAILLWGRGTDMKVALVLYACLWPILFNTIHGVHNVDVVAADTARVLGINRFDTIRRVYLPSASPFIFTGVKIAASVALILAVSAEIIAGGSSGLGIELQAAREVGNLKSSYSFTIVIGLVGLALHLVFEMIEKRIFAWSAESRTT